MGTLIGDWRDKTWLVVGLATLVITPLIAMAFLSLWWLQAERASLDGQRIMLAERSAVVLARQMDTALLNAVLPLHDAVIDANEAGGATAVRGLVASDPRLAFVTVEGLDQQPDFPPAGEMMTFYEDRVLERAGALLSKARTRVLESGGATWVGSALAEGPGVVACRAEAPGGSVCIVLEGGPLRLLADRLFDAELADNPDRPAVIQTDGTLIWQGVDADHRAARQKSLAEPFAAFAISVPLLEPDLLVLPRQAVFALPILVTLLAAAAILYWNHERHTREAERRIELLAQIAHELRTPLANLQLYADLLRRTSEKSEVERYCSVLDQECTRLSGVIENTLSLARNGQTFVPETREANPDAIVEDIVARFRPLLEAKGVAVSLDLAADQDLVFDRLAFERMLINLIDNACTHAPGSMIRIWTCANEGSLDFGVEDDGPGIPKEKRSSVFDAFETSRADGFGLGLATCRGLATAAGGSIRYDERAEGAGFCVRLPLLPGPSASLDTANPMERRACAS